METPPRAWGRRLPSMLPPQVSRNTPTGVGKTIALDGEYGWCWKHPHGRGEDSSRVNGRFHTPETPPRAWGRQPCSTGNNAWDRNTPTGVGKTNHVITKVGAIWKHPHGRGEDRLYYSNMRFSLETPPRAWGRLRRLRLRLQHHGNTPTGVGKTFRPAPWSSSLWKHPHGRGEDSFGIFT